MKTVISGGTLSLKAIGSSGLYYASFSNFGLGLTAKDVTDIECAAANSGVVWTASCTPSSNLQGVNGIVVQYGADNSRDTTLYMTVTGHWK